MNECIVKFFEANYKTHWSMEIADEEWEEFSILPSIGSTLLHDQKSWKITDIIFNKNNGVFGLKEIHATRK